jgi:enoyl reductase-like protein
MSRPKLREQQQIAEMKLRLKFQADTRWARAAIADAEKARRKTRKKTVWELWVDEKDKSDPREDGTR